MHFTDLFIKRPVLATVVSLVILVLGLRSVGLLPVRQYPLVQNAVVTVQTVYYGADPALVAGFITTPLENSIAQANGIDYLTSSSQLSVSTIQANLRLNEAVQKTLGLGDDRVYNNIQRYGNTTAATIPIALDEARKAGRVPDGALVCFVGLGAGFHWGAALMRA